MPYRALEYALDVLSCLELLELWRKKGDAMKTFKAYLKSGETLKFEAESFKVRSYNQRYYFEFQKGSEVDTSRFLALYEVSAFVPVIESVEGTGFHIHLKNGHSFDVIAHRFESGVVHRMAFYDSSNNFIRDIYVSEEEVVAIFPTDNPAIGV